MDFVSSRGIMGGVCRAGISKIENKYISKFIGCNCYSEGLYWVDPVIQSSTADVVILGCLGHWLAAE